MNGNILINEAGNDLSAEGYAALGVLLEMVWGIQTMGVQMANALDRIGVRNCASCSARSRPSTTRRRA